MGPQQKEFRIEILQAMQVAGPQHREFRIEILQAMQVAGPQHREFRIEILQAMQVGVGPNTENDLAFLLDSKSHLIFCVLN
ncbi:TPA: hypothetical protein PR177_000566 [Staphylococcus aureus]|uniref:hypothetical protein n=1 Tax=Staphylococcus aureus TaxID=1280 RepID=UPI00115526D2|nr:hypothetical protein [Staphylococcus aureus]EJN0110489.1 hypothetical protein [Staphylococcus aureus]EJN0121812.1 hypothetical protein [Staphylococcus aureus]EJN0130732.1 hypothetical protein [Staphylococcus aureus]EJN0185041.1 hypothetical protein [Staphylococcus aureus]EJN0196403.1 hypothetical protein [Staphylococcus aureus]